MTMATATLKFVGPSIGLSNLDVGYIIDGASDYDDARAAMMAAAPPMMGSFVPVDFRVQPLDDSDTLWEGTLTYGPRTDNSPDGQNDPTYSFELSVEQRRTTQSLATTAYGDWAPDFKGAINVQEDGTVEGVDLNFPVFSWIETHYLKYSRVNRAYFTVLFNSIARMNAGPFRDFQRGEVLFLGVTGSKRRFALDWEMQFRFIASPNVSNRSIGTVTVTEKLGHDYLWVRYTASPQTAIGGVPVIARIPQNVFVERVYQFANLDSLKLRNPLAL